MSADPDSDFLPAVPILRGLPTVPHATETRVRCFELYATVAARNCAHVERLFQREVAGTDIPVPTRAAISEWAREEGWSRQADEMWRKTKNWGVEQLRAYVFANAVLAEKNRHDVQLGLYAEDTNQALVLLKAGELADRKLERVMPLDQLKPGQEDDHEEDLSNAEKHQRAMDRLREIG